MYNIVSRDGDEIMKNGKEGQFVPYNLLTPGWEAEYTGKNDISQFTSDQLFKYDTDNEGHVYCKYGLWGFEKLDESKWPDEIKYMNSMQIELGDLKDDIRRIRQHIGGLVCCDSGVPVTIDEMLNAIGTGSLPEPAFQPGCWQHNGTRSTRPHQIESMELIEDVLKGFLDGVSEEECLIKYPLAKNFINRTYNWLGKLEDFSELQILILKRALLPFEYFTRHNDDIYGIYNSVFSEDGTGSVLDKQISSLVGLPKIYPTHKPEYSVHLSSLTDPFKKVIYKICGNIANGVEEMSDCHHHTFRCIENWIYAIGTLSWGIPTRKSSTERNRLGQLLFGYAFGIDKWLQNIPLQFLLLDLGHIDLGFDPRNEILRVYTYLGEERTQVKTWLAASLWYLITQGHAGLYYYGKSHEKLIETIQKKDLSVREWMDKALENNKF